MTAGTCLFCDRSKNHKRCW